MCEFVSWIEHKGEILFLTNDLLDTPKGKELIIFLANRYWDDVCGHGAIREYWGLQQGQGLEKEECDLSNPSKLPMQIVVAIKAGKMSRIGLSMNLLTPAASAEYEKIRQSAKAEYEKIRQPAKAKYDKICQSAWAKYDKICQSAWAEYKKICHTEFWELFANSDNRIEVWK